MSAGNNEIERQQSRVERPQVSDNLDSIRMGGRDTGSSERVSFNQEKVMASSVAQPNDGKVAQAMYDDMAKNLQIERKV